MIACSSVVSILPSIKPMTSTGVPRSERPFSTPEFACISCDVWRKERDYDNNKREYKCSEEDSSTVFFFFRKERKRKLNHLHCSNRRYFGLVKVLWAIKKGGEKIV